MKKTKKDLKHPEYDAISNSIMLDRLIAKFDTPLYHWTSLDCGQKILKSKKLRMTNAFYFSDNGEFIHGMQIIINLIPVLETIHSEVRYLKYIKQEFINFISNKDEVIPYVSCFTKNKSNDYLKEHYGDKGNGCLLEVHSTWFSRQKDVIIISVMYDYLKFVERAKELIIKYSKEIAQYRENDNLEALRNIAPMFIRDAVFLAISYKNKQYSPEEEIRFVSISIKDTPGYINTNHIILQKRYYFLKKFN